jgi:hypothetical protein
MKYLNGEEARLGDHVRLGDAAGIVVVSLDTDEYSPEQPKSQWAYLKRGVMVDFPQYGLIHYEVAEPDLKLIERATTADVWRAAP